MHVKHYDSDWAKAKSRDLVGKMLDETLLTFKRPETVKVLHFGGIDLAEARQVYLPRAIPASNIVSIERDRKIAGEQERAGLGIKVINTTLEAYAESAKEIDFDVISLDYIGPLGVETVRALHNVTRKNTKNRIVLHCANLMRRDPESKGVYIRGYMHNGKAGLTIDRDIQESKIPSSAQETFQRLRTANEMADQSLSILREDSYAHALYDCVSGVEVEALNKIYRFVARETYNEGLEAIEQRAQATFGKEFHMDREHPAKSSCAQPFVEFFQAEIREFLVKRCKESGTGSGKFPGVLWRALRKAAAKTKTYHLDKNSPYSYISESGAPMIGNVMYMVHDLKVFERARELAREVGFPTSLNIRYNDSLVKRVNAFGKEVNRLNNVDERITQAPHPVYAERVFLGNAAKPLLTKGRFIEELRAGTTIGEVQKKYRGWSNKPLPQWQAHFTMGTYGSKTSEEQEERNTETEKLTKDQAIDLIASGIPTQEIYKAWPTSFSVGQLAAFKAHITMGSYNGSE